MPCIVLGFPGLLESLFQLPTENLGLGQIVGTGEHPWI